LDGGDAAGNALQSPIQRISREGWKRLHRRGKNAAPLTVLLVQQSERAEQTRDDGWGPCGDQRAEQAGAAKIAYEFCRHIKHKPCAHATENHFRYATKTTKP
jgi:hypothetical protein